MKQFQLIILILLLALMFNNCQSSTSIINRKENINPTSTLSYPNLLEKVQDDTTNIVIINKDKWIQYQGTQELLDGEVLFIDGPSNGLIWFGSVRGLISFDGSDWDSYRLSKIFTDTQISSIAVGPNEVLWVGTKETGVFRYDGKEWSHFTTEEGGLASNNICALEVGSDNILWVGNCTGEISSYNGNNWISFDIVKVNSWTHFDYVRKIVVAETGIVWFGTDEGIIYSFDGNNWTSQDVRTAVGDSSSTLSQPRIMAMAIDYQDNLWYSAYRYGVIRNFEGQSEQFMNQAFLSYAPSSIAVTQSGNIWVGSLYGYRLAYYDESTWKTWGGEELSSFKGEYDPETPIGIFAIFIDDDGTIWLGTEEGVYQMQENDRQNK